MNLLIILNYLVKFIFLINFIGNYSKLIINDILITIGFGVLYFYGNMSLLKIGYDFSLYFYFFLISFTILIIIFNVTKLKGFVTTVFLFIFSICTINNSIYDASKEGIYKEEYQKMIVDNNLSKIDFFIYNIKQLNLLKQN